MVIANEVYEPYRLPCKVALYLWRIYATDTDRYFIANDGVKAGKVEGDAVIITDVNGSLIITKGFGKGIGG